jgi:hypothetical protein
LHVWSSTGRAKAAMAKRQLKNGLIANMLSFCATVIVPPPLVGGHTRASCPPECGSVLESTRERLGRY